MTRAEAGRLGAIASAKYQTAKHEKYLEEYNKHPHICINCGETLSYEKRANKFCSQSCSAVYYNNKRGNKHTAVARKNAPIKLCAFCGKEIPFEKKSNIYCSQLCATEARQHKKFLAIEEASEFPEAFQGEASRPLVKSYLEHKYGHKCAICGITEWRGKPVPIVVDHIDGNALNRKLDNFRLVCANCDAQLPTYKSKNKHGRQWRRKYETTFRGTE